MSTLVKMRIESKLARPMRMQLTEDFICGLDRTTMDRMFPKRPRTPMTLRRTPRTIKFARSKRSSGLSDAWVAKWLALAFEVVGFNVTSSRVPASISSFQKLPFHIVIVEAENSEKNYANDGAFL